MHALRRIGELAGAAEEHARREHGLSIGTDAADLADRALRAEAGGERASASAMTSNPYPVASGEKPSARRREGPVSSRIEVSYSARFSRRMTGLPGSRPSPQSRFGPAGFVRWLPAAGRGRIPTPAGKEILR